MTDDRKDVLALYTVNEHGIIISPGKFEGEMLYVPYLWSAVLEGYGEDEFADDEDGELIASYVEITDNDRAEFPELENAVEARLSEDSQGFVWCETRDEPFVR